MKIPIVDTAEKMNEERKEKENMEKEGKKRNKDKENIVIKAIKNIEEKGKMKKTSKITGTKR